MPYHMHSNLAYRGLTMNNSFLIGYQIPRFAVLQLEIGDQVSTITMHKYFKVHCFIHLYKILQTWEQASKKKEEKKKLAQKKGQSDKFS